MEQASIYASIASTPSEEDLLAMAELAMSSMSREELTAQAMAGAAGMGFSEEVIQQYMENLSQEELESYMREALTEQLRQTYTASAAAGMESFSTAELSALLSAADEPANLSAEAYHALWERGKAELSREEQNDLWVALRDRAIERKLGHFAGRKYLATHPDEKASTPAWAGKKAAAPAKQEKPAKKAAAPAKQEKPANAMTTKEALGRIFETLVAMDKHMAATDKRLAAIEKKLAK